MVVSVAIMIASFKHTVYTWVDQTVQADPHRQRCRPVIRRVDGAAADLLTDELRTLEGVLEVDALRSRSIPYQDRQVILNIADLDVFARHTEYPFLEGDHDTIFREVISQDSVIVSENFRYRFAVQRGDHITLPTPEGPRSFRVAGVSIDYSSDQGTIVMHWGTFRKYWTEQVVDTIGVFVKPGANLEAVSAEIQQRFGRSHRVFIFSNQTFKEEIYQLINQSFVITYALEIIAIAVGLMGIATALYTSVLERRREISVLRALGAFRQQIRKIILLESGLLGLLGVGVGTVCGVCLSVILVYIINRQAFGWTLRLSFPAWTVAVDLGLIFLTALAAGIWPAHQAGRVRLTETLRME
jgi:putative ABC transport system permease protein